MSYVIVDVEADGPIPAEYSMVCFGAVIFDERLDQTFYGQTRPVSDRFVPEALAVSGITREQHLAFDEPKAVMPHFARWIAEHTSGRPIFVSDNVVFDWQFINYYFHRFVGRNPFGFSEQRFIKIGGAREHNLKNLTLQIPRDKLVVVTGLSGSGKSSLAFDTIYAEGQRKYVEASRPTRASSSTRCRSRMWISSRVFRRPLPLSSAVPAAARARSSPPPPKFTITCACFMRTSARRIARKPACPSPRKHQRHRG
jgi:hypothetical protein